MPGGDLGDDDPVGAPDERRRRQRPLRAGPVDDGGPPTQAVPTVFERGPTPAGTAGSGPSDPSRLSDPSHPSDPSHLSDPSHPSDRSRPGVRDRPDPGRPDGSGRPRRYRVLPRTVLGITAMLLAFALGAGFSGAVLYSYYQYRLDQNTSRVNALVDGYKKDFARAEGDIGAAAANAQTQIKQSLTPIRQLEADPAAQAALVKRLAPSLLFVSTRDANGQPSVGTAFVVASDSTESLLLTSYTTVEAATTVPGPTVQVRQGNSGAETTVSLRTWDAADDLALIVLPHGGLPAVHVAAEKTVAIGEPVYALSGLGTDGASIAQGEVDDTSSSGVATDVPLDAAFQGGPVVDASGQVIAVASRTYAPFGFTPGAVTYAPFVDLACQKVLSCPGGSIGASR